MTQPIEVDTKTFIRFWLVILGLGLLGLFAWKARVGLIIVGIALFLSIAIQPLAAKIKRLTGKQDSSFASVMAYVIVIVALALIAAVVAPVVIDETVRFVGQLPETFETTFGGWDGINAFGRNFGIENLQSDLLDMLNNFSKSFVSNLGNVLVSGIGAISQVATAIIVTLVLTLLFAIEGPGIISDFWKLMEGKQARKSPKKPASEKSISAKSETADRETRSAKTLRAYQHLSERIADVIANYVSRQVLVALLDGCVTAVAVLLLAFLCAFSPNLSIPMGLIAFTFYLIPMFGPIISCILISLLLFFSSPAAGIIFLIFYIIYAQIENNVIAPKLQASGQGLPASLILTAIVIGMYMFGLIGAVIAIPIAGCIKVILEELPNLRSS